MENYKYEATGLITRSFEEHGIQFKEFTFYGTEVIEVKSAIESGPAITISIIIPAGDGGAAVRVINMISRVPAEKRSRVIEACNMLNEKCRFIKFYLDRNNAVSVGYDLPASGTENIGDMVLETVGRIRRLLNNEYKVFIKALYTDDELNIPAFAVDDKTEEDETQL